jgi:endogenous inhibitor of DNA gyrase (YacG/DUF329 family)
LTATPAKTVPCPRCGAPSVYAPENRWRPFCSERCRVIDLGAWASEAYRVPVTAQDPAEAAPDSGGEPGEPRQ